MAEPLKEMYRETFLREFAAKVRAVYPVFDTDGFVEATLGDGWDELELKGRIRRITESLGGKLPLEYGKALDVLEAIADNCRGFPYLFFPDFVERYGLEHWERSVDALAAFTPMSSSEFAVRPFIRRDEGRMLATMMEWASHPDEHVRRLASEGCRPRLPWADALPAFKRDPSPILPILERLRADSSEYVRRSVANNLNDISKDHPELVAKLAERWLGSDAATDWIVRHACRGLIRAAHPAVMALFGMRPQPGVRVEEWTVSPDSVPVGGSVDVRYALAMPPGEPIKLRLELAVYYPRANGRLYRKLFKLSEKVVLGGSRAYGSRRHSFADLSTRRHYPGVHKVALLLNGEQAAEAVVELLPPENGGERR
ncbi:DNA alkylation repair protein [Cohnella faecalis]|uniref:DNA alkylation repair protein n=1 Tax=Cohnella faecalis TaxID=2315694 RepID=A0A398CG69_9BACL|nr:DNA alkylation repair protein [Cohnella faecalis]RIE02216.1 hypothetical protein D3H35_15880 [Cohnella faecalis]